MRRRQLLVFDRFLARLARELGNAMMLKGGLALELRLERARTTKDVDLRLVGSPDGLLDRPRDQGPLRRRRARGADEQPHATMTTPSTAPTVDLSTISRAALRSQIVCAPHPIDEIRRPSRQGPGA